MEVTAQESSTTTKAKILGYLKEFGDATVIGLAEYLKLTPMAVRKHLNSLSIQGIVRTKNLNKRVGRPVILYYLKNEEIKETDLFAVGILDTVKENYGESVVVDLVSKRNNKFFEKYKYRLLNKTFYERIYETAKIFNENGFDTLVEEDKVNNKIFIRHKTCPLLNIANKHPVLCSSEKDILESFIEAKVSRVCYFCDGGQYCAYEVLSKTTI